MFINIKMENFTFFRALKIEKDVSPLYPSNTRKKTTRKRIYPRKNQISNSCLMVSTTSKTSD